MESDYLGEYLGLGNPAGTPARSIFGGFLKGAVIDGMRGCD